MNNLHVFLGASVADAAARPVQWIKKTIPLSKSQYVLGLHT